MHSSTVGAGQLNSEQYTHTEVYYNGSAHAAFSFPSHGGFGHPSNKMFLRPKCMHLPPCWSVELLWPAAHRCAQHRRCYIGDLYQNDTHIYPVLAADVAQCHIVWCILEMGHHDVIMCSHR